MGIQSLGQEDPLEKEMATCSSILAWKNPMDRGAWQAIVHGVAKSRTRLIMDMHTHTHTHTRTQTHTRAHACTGAHACTDTHTCARTHAHMHTHMHTHACPRTHAHIIYLAVPCRSCSMWDLVPGIGLETGPLHWESLDHQGRPSFFLLIYI